MISKEGVYHLPTMTKFLRVMAQVRSHFKSREPTNFIFLSYLDKVLSIPPTKMLESSVLTTILCESALFSN